MAVSVALRERGRLAVLLNSVSHAEIVRAGGPAPDPRNLRTWRQFVLGVLVQRSVRLVRVAQVVAPQRRTRRVKSAAAALGYLLADAQWNLRPFSTRVLLAALQQLDPSRLTTYRGYGLLVIDPTEYPKRSRGRGKHGRHMQHIGRVRQAANGQPRRRPPKQGQPRAPQAPAVPGAAAPRRTATTYGYVDVWAGLVLKKQQFLPLARHLYSNHHPQLKSQNRVEEAVLGTARGLLRRLGLQAIVIGDRGLGRKELLIRLALREQPFVFRVDADLQVGPPAQSPCEALAQALARQASLGRAVWHRGAEPPLVCEVRTLSATLRYSRTGRQDDYSEATLQFVEFRPEELGHAPLVLATTLPVGTLADAIGIAWVYGQRWSVETGFEVMKGWGLARFMVRDWQAIDRLLWIVALAYTLMLLALRAPPLAPLCAQAVALLQDQAVLGRRLTVGKLAEAIGLDFAQHRRAWTAVWRC
jgi:hypothetical protein